MAIDPVVIYGPTRNGVTTRIANATYSAASITIPFAANQYSRLIVSLDWDAGGVDNVALTGLSAGSYGWGGVYAQNAAGGYIGGANANSWVFSTGSGATSFGAGTITVELPPAPRKKFIKFDQADDFAGGSTLSRQMTGISEDVTNNPTALVITLDASRNGGYTVWAWS